MKSHRIISLGMKGDGNIKSVHEGEGGKIKKSRVLAGILEKVT